MFGLSFTEIMVVMVISFLIFGPEQFPIMVKKAIKQISEFKKYIAQAQNSFHDFTRDVEKEFDPNQWTGDSDGSSVSQNQYGEEKDTPLLAKLSTNPDEYDAAPIQNWRWQAKAEGKPGDFEQEPFDWKNQAST